MHSPGEIAEGRRVGDVKAEVLGIKKRQIISLADRSSQVSPATNAKFVKKC